LDLFIFSANPQYSFNTIDAIFSRMKNSSHMEAFTIALINEALDTHLAGFGSPAGLIADVTDRMNTYLACVGVLKKIAAVDKRIPVMLQDCF